jgi:hypothetical protein
MVFYGYLLGDFSFKETEGIYLNERFVGALINNNVRNDALIEKE